jgi:transducin (beta)-like 1
MSISSDEINFLIYRYLQENGFSHTAFAFAHESLVIRSSVAQVELPAGALITFLQKGLEYVGIEEHINEDGSVREFDGNYSLLSPFICEAIGVKEERRYRTKLNNDEVTATAAAAAAAASTAAASASSSSAAAAAPAAAPAGDGVKTEESAGAEMEVTEAIAPALPATISTELGFKSIELKCHAGREVYTSSWSPVTQQVASGSSDGTCRLWGFDGVAWDRDPAEAVSVLMAVLPHYREEGENFKDVTSIQWAPQGHILATGCYDGMVRLWNSDGSLRTVLDKHEGPVFALKWSRDGNMLLTGGNDRKAIVWDPASGNIVKSYFLHSAPILDVDWGEGDMFATSSSDRVIHVCKVGVQGNAALATFIGHSNEINSVCWSPDGRLIASASDDATAKVCSV